MKGGGGTNVGGSKCYVVKVFTLKRWIGCAEHRVREAGGVPKPYWGVGVRWGSGWLKMVDLLLPEKFVLTLFLWYNIGMDQMIDLAE